MKSTLHLFSILLALSIPLSAYTQTSSTYTDPIANIEFIFVKGGCFDMGDIFGDGDVHENPVHNVCVDDFYIGKYEITQEQWRIITGKNPIDIKDCGARCPVEFVSWNNIHEFIQLLNARTSKKFRLPTEAEWEYAARSAGKKEKYAGTNDKSELGDYAWYNDNAGGKVHPIGQKKPNALGIHDMSGNVWEWVYDRYGFSYSKDQSEKNPSGPPSGDRRVIRGGDYAVSEKGVRTVHRAGIAPGSRYSGTGFRLAISLQ